MIDGQLLDHPLEPDRVMPSVIDLRPLASQTLIGPSTGRGIGNGRDIGRDVGRLAADQRRAQRKREAAIERGGGPVIQGQAGEKTGGDSQSGSKPPTGVCSQARA